MQNSLVVLVALFSATSALASSVVRGPYVQQVTPDSAVVVWRDAAGQHEERVTDARYVVDGSTYEIRRPSSPSSLRIWAFGDSGTGLPLQRDVRDAALAYMSTRPADLILHLGDIAYETGTEDELQTKFFDIYTDVMHTTPVWPAMGNHEGLSSPSWAQIGPWFDAFVLPKNGEAGGVPSGTEAYYSFDVGDVHFVSLDSYGSSRDVDGPMLSWLEQDLSSTTKPWLIAFWHHPPYSKGSHDSDNEWELMQMRENVLPILEAHGVDLVLAGHSHGYERSFLVDGAYETPTTAANIVDATHGPYQKPVERGAHQGTVYAVCGHAGTPEPTTREHPLMVVTSSLSGSCVLDVDDNVLRLRNVLVTGQVLDDVAIVRGQALLVTAPRGGETLTVGAPYELRWATPGAEVSTVSIEISADGGATWTVLADDAPNSGAHAWTPTATASSILVRISANDAALADTIDSPIVVVEAPPPAVDEEPADEEPADEEPADEEPVDEAPVDEAPVEERGPAVDELPPGAPDEDVVVSKPIDDDPGVRSRGCAAVASSSGAVLALAALLLLPRRRRM